MNTIARTHNTGSDTMKQSLINKIYLSHILLFMTTIASNGQSLKTVPNVDLNKYAGKWFEIASYPQHFQKGCHCTTAEYTVREKGYVIV